MRGRSSRRTSPEFRRLLRQMHKVSSRPSTPLEKHQFFLILILRCATACGLHDFLWHQRHIWWGRCSRVLSRSASYRVTWRSGAKTLCRVTLKLLNNKSDANISQTIIRANCCCFCLILGVRNTVEATAVLVDAHCNVCRHYGAKPAFLNSMQQKMPQRWRLDSLAESCEKLFVSCVCGTPTSRDYAKEVAEYGSNNQKS